MSRVRTLAPVLALAAAGCFSHRLATNAPGHVSLEPPADGSPHQPAAPTDPGDQSVTAHLGGFLILGTDLDVNTNGLVGSAALGVELNVLYGFHDESAVKNLSFLFPDRAVGATVGFSYFSLERVRLFHVELEGALRCHETVLCGVSGGLVWDPGGGGAPSTYGPQITVAIGPIFGRVAYLHGQVTPVHLGLLLGPTFSLVWSR